VCILTLFYIARHHLSRRAAFSISRGENKGVYKRFAPFIFSRRLQIALCRSVMKSNDLIKREGENQHAHN
jgi:hypothetical protein